jgi:hypothetical protein
MHEYDDRERERDRRMEEHIRDIETRMRDLDNEQVRLASALDHEQSTMRDQLRQYKTAIETNTVILMGDGDKREGLVAWKNNMDRRYKAVLVGFGAIGTALLELLRARLSEFLK